MDSSQSILPYSYYDSYYNMNDSSAHSRDAFCYYCYQDYYNMNDLEKQLPEYRCPYNDYIQINISDDENSEHLASEADDILEPDIENAIVRQVPQPRANIATNENNNYHANDYYNSLISYYVRLCNTTTNFLDFDLRD